MPIIPNNINGTVVIQSCNVASVVQEINSEIVITGVIPIINTHINVTNANNDLFNNVFIIF